MNRPFPMNFTVHYLDNLPDFLIWFGMGVGLLAVFLFAYALITPWREFKLIREGNLAAAVSLMGTAVGYSMVLSSVIRNATSRTDMLTWSLVGLVVQLLAFLAARLIIGSSMKERMLKGDLSVGIILGGISLCFGILNAATMVPDTTADLGTLLDILRTNPAATPAVVPPTGG